MRLTLSASSLAADLAGHLFTRASISIAITSESQIALELISDRQFGRCFGRFEGRVVRLFGGMGRCSIVGVSCRRSGDKTGPTNGSNLVAAIPAPCPWRVVGRLRARARTRGSYDRSADGSLWIARISSIDSRTGAVSFASARRTLRHACYRMATEALIAVANRRA